MRSTKVYSLFWSLASDKGKKINVKHVFLCSCVIRNANIDDVIMTFLPRE